MTPNYARKADGWAPVVDYPNGGRIVGQQRCATPEAAIIEAREYIDCVRDCPQAFKNNHPGPNQCIDLGERE